MSNTKKNNIPELPEVVGSNAANNAEKVYEVERLINTLAAIIEKYAGQLDATQPQRKAG